MAIAFSSLLQAIAEIGACTTMAHTAATGLPRCTRTTLTGPTFSTSVMATTTCMTKTAVTVTAFVPSQNNAIERA